MTYFYPLHLVFQNFYSSFAPHLAEPLNRVFTFGLLDFKKSLSKATYKISYQILKLTSNFRISDSKHLAFVSIPSHQQIQV
ncbi:hypothetical protein A9996_02935 [Gelidibacter algens]|jgi:hypothetical protein|nr:hypothetical protein A9996_02935 [Gelidibacter algens]